jgi:radical SAM protein with 4Fe4S-binding SPASM domain
MAKSRTSLYQRVKKKCREEGLSAFLDDVKTIIALKAIENVGSPHFVSIYKPKIKIAHVELTNACNLKCKMCYSRKRSKGFMEWNLFQKVIDEFAELEVPDLALHYAGESLLHPDFRDMLKYAMEKHHRFKSIGWFDNGMLFDTEIADLVVELGVDEITFSLEGLGEANDSVRIGSKYAVVAANINYLIQKRGKQSKPSIIIHMTDVGQNKQTIADCADYWVNKVNVVTVSSCLDSNLQASNIKNPAHFKMCHSPFEFMAVLWNGDVVPCCHDLEGKLTLGNVTNVTIKKVWNSSSYRTLRKNCATNTFPESEICYTCNAWKTTSYLIS